MRKSSRLEPEFSGPTRALESAPPKWPGYSCHAMRAIFSTKAVSRRTRLFLTMRACSLGTHRPAEKYCFARMGISWRYSPVGIEEEASGGPETASLFHADRRKREPFQGLAPALRRAAGAEPAGEQARGGGG